MWRRPGTSTGDMRVEEGEGAVFGNGGAGVGEEARVLDEVVVGEEDGAKHFVGLKEVVARPWFAPRPTATPPQHSTLVR